MGAEMGPGPDVEHHHHHQTGHRWLDITLACSAVFISLMSLLLALQHGKAMEKMVEVSSWPYVWMDTWNSLEDGTPSVRVVIVNKGVGPAKVRSIEVFYHGAAQPDPDHLVAGMLKVPYPLPFKFMQSDVLDSVLSAREQIALFQVSADRIAPEQMRSLQHETVNLDFRVCYCSVFDECSIWDSRVAAMTTSTGKACPVPKTMFLH